MQERYDRLLRVALPIVVLALGLLIWEAIVRINKIPPYILPSPSLILRTLIDDWELLSQSLVVTLATTVEGFLLAAFGGVGLAVMFNQSRLLEYSLYPYAVILQVTPIVAIAPLLLIYLPQPLAVLACAWIVAFFPVLANTTLGLHSVDRNLADLFTLYGASRRQLLWYLKLPSALPYIIGGLRIAGGLSLIGAVVAEIAAGSAGAGSGLAYRIADPDTASTSRACSPHCCYCRSPASRSFMRFRCLITWRCAAGMRARWSGRRNHRHALAMDPAVYCEPRIFEPARRADDRPDLMRKPRRKEHQCVVGRLDVDKCSPLLAGFK